MIDMGILVPTKVTRLALQNAASVAELLLTTEVRVALAQKEEHDYREAAPGPFRWRQTRAFRMTAQDPMIFVKAFDHSSKLFRRDAAELCAHAFDRTRTGRKPCTSAFDGTESDMRLPREA